MESVSAARTRSVLSALLHPVCTSPASSFKAQEQISLVEHVKINVILDVD